MFLFFLMKQKKKLCIVEVVEWVRLLKFNKISLLSTHISSVSKEWNPGEDKSLENDSEKSSDSTSGSP